jgi:hypothetical protein
LVLRDVEAILFHEFGNCSKKISGSRGVFDFSTSSRTIASQQGAYSSSFSPVDSSYCNSTLFCDFIRKGWMQLLRRLTAGGWMELRPF